MNSVVVVPSRSIASTVSPTLPAFSTTNDALDGVPSGIEPRSSAFGRTTKYGFTPAPRTGTRVLQVEQYEIESAFSIGPSFDGVIQTVTDSEPSPGIAVVSG